MNISVELQCSCYSLFIFVLGERTRLRNLNYPVGSLGLNEKGRYSHDRREQVVGNRTGYRDSSETKPQTARGVAAESSKKIKPQGLATMGPQHDTIKKLTLCRYSTHVRQRGSFLEVPVRTPQPQTFNVNVNLAPSHPLSFSIGGKKPFGYKIPQSNT